MDSTKENLQRVRASEVEKALTQEKGEPLYLLRYKEIEGRLDLKHHARCLVCLEYGPVRPSAKEARRALQELGEGQSGA